jgi:hypothetical protein
MISPQLQPLTSEIFDIIVVGSGSAGSAAAIAAARSGARTLLVERYGFLGGTSTAVLDTFYGFYTPGAHPRKVVGGIGDLVIAELNRYGASIERPNTYGAGTGITYNAEYLKVVWERLAAQAGAVILMHAWLQDAVVRDRRVESLVLATRSGLRTVRGRAFVDATGDADLCAFAGVPCEIAGEHQPAQSLTTTFKVVNVDTPRRKSVSEAEFHRRMADAAASGHYQLPRKEGSDHITPVPGMFVTNMTRVEAVSRVDGHLRNATDSAFLSSAEIRGREQALEYMRFLRERIPGYEGADLVGFSTQIGVRETRRIFGDYRLTREDVLSAAQFDDQIGLCGAPIEDHHPGADTVWQYLPEGQAVGIPFRCMLPSDLDNVVVAGRCFSATHDAHASVRSMAQCMAMGEAAGTALGLCARHQKSPRELNTSLLRDELRRGGAVL